MKKVVVVLILALGVSCASAQQLSPLEYMNDSKMVIVEYKKKEECWEYISTQAWKINCGRLPYSVKAKIELIAAGSNNPEDYTLRQERILALIAQSND